MLSCILIFLVSPYFVAIFAVRFSMSFFIILQSFFFFFFFFGGGGGGVLGGGGIIFQCVGGWVGVEDGEWAVFCFGLWCWCFYRTFSWCMFSWMRLFSLGSFLHRLLVGFGWMSGLVAFFGVGVRHYSDVIMGTIASQITSLMIAYSTVYSGADQRKHQSSTSLAFMWGIHRWPVNSPHKWPVTRIFFPFDDVIMR